VLGAGVGRLPPRVRGAAVVAAAVIGLAAAVGAAVLAVALVFVDWAFGAEKLLIAAPIGIASSLAGVAFVLWSLRRPGGAPGRSLLGVAIAAALGGAIGPLVILVVGPMFNPVIVIVVVGVWAAASAVAVLVSLGRPLRTTIPTGVLAVLCAALLALFTVFGPSLAASAAGHHIPEAGGADAPQVSVEALRETGEGSSVRHFDLEARHESVELPDGSTFDGIGFGSIPGPPLVVTQGELVEVALTNRDVEEGVTIHWHGYDVPNGEDGVAGVTQDVVSIGESFTYRFLADEVGSYWYHTHQGALEGIRRGLYGSLVVLPAQGSDAAVDATALIHTLGGTTLVGDGAVLQLPADQDIRLRLADTDQGPRRVVLDGDARVLAIDGRDLDTPAALPAGTVLRIPAGGRVDLGVAAGAATSLAVEGGKGSGVAFGAGEVAKLTFAGPEFDPLSAATGPMPQWASGPYDVHATQVLDRLVRVVDGLPRLADTINGAAYPSIEPIVVEEGDVVEVTIVNRGTETHPMHLHGHHALVLSRDGVDAEGALWLDTVDVRPGEVWTIAFVADNPGIWMDHCHNLEHARDGMVMHLAYTGVTTPFDIGGEHGNEPE
jgi:FtsP/CotA-like multicopper oxidase with cupredoxin domain